MGTPAFLSAACVIGLLSTACGSGSSGTAPAPTNDAGVDASAEDGSTHDAAVMDSGAAVVDAAAEAATVGSFNVLDHIPMFNMYSSSQPTDYAPPPGVLMWQYGTIFVTRLDAQQQALIGSDLAAQVTYYAQCDNYDRIGGVFVILEPKGQAPQPTDPRIELVRFITPFSDYSQGPLATYAFPKGSLSAFASVLADPTHDVWIGMGGGSYPSYPGNPCTGLSVDAGDIPGDAGSEFLEVGFSYSLDFVSTMPLTPGAAMALPAFTLPSDAGGPVAISNVSLTSTPIQGTFTNPSGAVSGHVTVIVSGHGSAQGGDEYEYTQDAVSVGSLDPDAGTPIGTFSTEIDCSPYASASPDGNPGIFEDNTTFNPRNWCPGALVVSHTFPAMLPAGSSVVVLGIDPGQVPSGSYFQTSITFTSP